MLRPIFNLLFRFFRTCPGRPNSVVLFLPGGQWNVPPPAPSWRTITTPAFVTFQVLNKMVFLNKGLEYTRRSD